MPWLLAIAAITITSYEATVRTLDGNTVQGTVASWDQSGLELSASGSLQRIPRSELAELTFRANDSASTTTPAVEVLLGDGSVIPAGDCEVQGEQIRILEPIGAAKAQPEWNLPVNAVNSLRFDLSETGQDEVWRQLTQRARTSDMLVVHKKSSGTLDFVEGVVKQVTAEAVTIELDEEPMEVPRKKAFGIVFYRRDPEQLPTTSMKLRGPHRLLLVARDVRLGDDVVAIDLLGGATLQLQPESLAGLEFTHDSLRYLVDLKPDEVSVRWQPFFKLPADSNLLVQWGKPRVNESFHGGPLRLVLQQADMQPTIREFERGIAMRSRSEATYQLPSEYRALEALVGMDPAAHADADALLIIEADGQSLGEWRLARNEAAKSIDVDISGKRTLRLLVDYGSGTDSGDVVHICEPRLVK